MIKYFQEGKDIFVNAFFGANGDLFVPSWLNSKYELSMAEYWDKKAYEKILETHVKVEGKDCNYWVSGNVLDQWQGETRKERARLFAIWYHQNKEKLKVYDLND